MLNVHRTENQLKTQTVSVIFGGDTLASKKINLIFLYPQEELDALRAKFEKVEKERQELRQQNEKLESRVSKLKTDSFSQAISTEVNGDFKAYIYETFSQQLVSMYFGSVSI